MHGDSFTTLLIALCVILFAAKWGGHLAVRSKQPPVLGELVFGILLGNLGLFGCHSFDQISRLAALDTLANIGVLLLLFHVGLESTVGEMARVGLSSTLVATLGVIAPFFLGWGVSAWSFPGHSVYMHVFIGATLTATSVGITARVFRDLNKTRTDEAKIILGAAVIDDVMGLIILSAVTGLITAADQGVPFSFGTILSVTAKALLFLAGAIFVGQFASKQLLRLGAKLQGSGILLGFALSICFLFSYLAALVGLAPIVGAFAAGLILEPAHFQGFAEKRDLKDLLTPVLEFLVPVFFVLMGMRVDLTTFGQGGAIGFAFLLTLAAIAGKQLCSLGVVREKVNRLVIGIGMIPRGEVGLIFANVGMTLHVKGERIVDASVFSSVVMMVVVTTLVAPPILAWLLTRRE